MADEPCVFCRIVSGAVPAELVAREAGCVAFHDIAPKAPIHLLIVPERHVASIADVAELPPETRAGMLGLIADLAERFGLTESGYRVTTNVGENGRQSVFHLHWHLMGGAVLSPGM